jgi:MOSC domain-containing protein YiiM
VGEVLHLFQSLAHGEPAREFDEVFAVEDKGFKDCIHGRGSSKRQVLLMDSETLEEFGVTPGRVKENITTRGLPLGTLQLGARLRVGSALLEVTSPCVPCRQMEEIREGLREAIRGRRGLLCRVVESGSIRRGDCIEIAEWERVAS